VVLGSSSTLSLPFISIWNFDYTTIIFLDKEMESKKKLTLCSQKFFTSHLLVMQSTSPCLKCSKTIKKWSRILQVKHTTIYIPLALHDRHPRIAVMLQPNLCKILHIQQPVTMLRRAYSLHKQNSRE